MSLTWNGDAALRSIQAHLDTNARAALKMIVDEMTAVVGSPYPPASNPGEPPHRRTGDLRSSISFTYANGKGQIAATSEHAGLLEYGTQKMSPRPFFFSTIAENEGEFMEILGG